MHLLKLAAVGILLILLVLGATMAFASGSEATAEDAGVVESFGLFLILIAAVAIVLESIGAMIWWALT